MANTKYVKSEIELVRFLTKKTFRAKINNTGAIAVLKKAKSFGYSLNMISASNDIYVDNEDITLLGNGFSVFISEMIYTGSGERLRKGQRPLSHKKANVYKFSNRPELASEAFFKICIPTSKEFDCFFIFDEDSADLDNGRRSRGVLSVQINNILFNVYSIKENDEFFLFIEAHSRMTESQFGEYIWTICLGVGFVNGKLWQGDQYLFSYLNPEMDDLDCWSYTRTRDSILSIYPVVTTNPWGWVRRSEHHLAELYKNKISLVSKEQISKLCQWIYDYDTVKAIVLIVIEAKRASLLMMPAGFAIALEGLATYFEEKFPEKSKPITVKSKAKIVISKLFKVLDDYKDDPEISGMDILKTKISDLNNPTNRERLQIPFKILEIPLTLEDKKALDYRNALLHGNVLLIPSDRKMFEMNELELGMRLMTLANAIIMKFIGYDGVILNHVKTQEEACNKLIDEDYYRGI